MGSSNINPISYRTKDKLQISYIFWDLKGKNRFPEPPGDTEINFMLERCLEQIEVDESQMNQIKEFNSKYKYRFVILHKRKVAEAKKQRQLQELKRSSVKNIQSSLIKNTQQKSKVHDLEQLMKDIQLNQTVIKVALMKIDKYIAEKYAHNQFLSIRGLERLLQLLEKAIKINASGTKTNFSNQVQLLKFLKFFSYRHPKQFYNYIPKIKNYGSILMRTYHPVNTHITAYCLNLLTDYLWRVEQGEHIIKILQCYRLQYNFESFMSPFAEALNETDSILMVYYNLKFINQLIASVIQEDKKELLKQSLAFIKYGYVLDGVKAKLQQNYYNIQNTTFIAMHQKIFKYVTKSKSEKKIVQDNRISYRNTLNLNSLHEQILLNFLESNNNVQDDEFEDNPNQQIIVAYLGESDRKTFNKFILDALTQLQKYNQLEFYLQNSSKNGENQQETHQMVSSKINLQNLQTYFTRIKQSCTKNSCNEFLNSCFKNLQYFEKNQWKHLERFIFQELGLEKNIGDQVEELRRNLDEKQSMIKRIIKQNIQLRNQVAQMRMKDSFPTQRSVGKLQAQTKDFLSNQNGKINQTLQQSNFSKKKQLHNLPLPPQNVAKTKKGELIQMPASLGKFLPKGLQLPPLPDMSKKKQNIKNQEMNRQDVLQSLRSFKLQKPIRDRPKLNFYKQTHKVEVLPTKNSRVQDTATSVNSLAQLNNTLLPPPPLINLISPTITSPPPPLISSGNFLPLPPPPPDLIGTLNHTSIGQSTILPPPPSMSSFNLPPPPSMSSFNLPPPPSMSSFNLPPPPSMSTLNLPPPPSMQSTNMLPPPPSISQTNILPPPPTMGLANLLPPPPPSFGSGNLLPPPPYSIGLGNMLPPPLGLPSLPGAPSLPGMPSIPNLSMGGFAQVPQKTKQKRKPKVPLKACNFTTLSYDKILSTIFQEIDDTKVILNQDELVEMFTRNMPSSLQKNGEQRKVNSAIIPNTKVKESIKLLSSDRWRNVEIILAKLRIPCGQLRKALIQCTGKFTSQSVLESIQKILPTQQEQQMIKTFEGNEDDLGKPEKFLKQITEVKQYTSRVKSMIFSNLKEEYYYQLSSKLQQLTLGFTSLKQNKRLKYVLEICLSLGNYLNGTTLKGGAWGFKIQTIERLQQIKSTNNKMNAAFYLIRQVWKEYPYPIFQKDQIQLYQYLGKMPVSQANIEIGELNSYSRAIKKAYESHDKSNPNDNIGSYCEQIMMELTVKLQQYKETAQKLSDIYFQCAKFYCQDGKKMPSDEFGKKMFQCILFISNTEKMFKIIQDKRLKDESRKAVTNQMIYSEGPNPESNKKSEKQIEYVSSQKIEQVKMPDISKLPIPPKIIVNKEDKLKEIQKMQQQRQKKALQEVMMRRTSKLQAYRMSKISQTNNNKKGLDQIDFLKGKN